MALYAFAAWLASFINPKLYSRYNILSFLYFVNKQNIIFFKFSEQCSEIGFLLQHRTGGFNNIHPHFIGNYTGKCCLSKSGRSIKQDMIQSILSLSGRFNKNL